MQQFSPILTPSLASVYEALNRLLLLRVEDVTEFNALASLRGYQNGFAHSTTPISASYSAGRGDLYIDVDATSAGVTVTLDSDPLDGQTHHVFKLDSSGNAVTVSGNGKNINGSATASTTTQYGGLHLVFMGDAGEWRKW